MHGVAAGAIDRSAISKKIDRWLAFRPLPDLPLALKLADALRALGSAGFR
jgi:hypothetical protein